MRTSATATGDSSCAATMPDAWCTTNWKSSPDESWAASSPGGAAAWSMSTTRGAVPAGGGVGWEKEQTGGGVVAHRRRVGLIVAPHGPGGAAVQVEGAEPG